MDSALAPVKKNLILIHNPARTYIFCVLCLKFPLIGFGRGRGGGGGHACHRTERPQRLDQVNPGTEGQLFSPCQCWRSRSGSFPGSGSFSDFAKFSKYKNYNLFTLPTFQKYLKNLCEKRNSIVWRLRTRDINAPKSAPGNPPTPLV